jgi:hypothetical protein
VLPLLRSGVAQVQGQKKGVKKDTRKTRKAISTRREILKKMHKKSRDKIAQHQLKKKGTWAFMIGNLVSLSAPPILLFLLSCLGSIEGLQKGTPLEFLEVFAGVGNVHRAFVEGGYSSAKYDLRYNKKWNDILGVHGYVHLLHLSSLLRAGAAALAAPVCSTWVAMSRASTGRTPLHPMGTPGQGCVERANEMVARMCLVLWLWSAKGVFWVWGQGFWGTPRGQAHRAPILFLQVKPRAV